MKKALFITIVIVAVVFIYRYLNKKTTTDQIKAKADNLTPDQQKALVINLINTTPGWKDYIIAMQKKGIKLEITKNRTVREIFSFGTYDPVYIVPVTLENLIPHEAARHLKLRGFEDIQANPGDFAKYPRGTTKEEDWLKGY